MGELLAKWPRDRALQVRAVLDRLALCGCGSNNHWECLIELLSEAEHHTEGQGFYRDKWFEFGAKVLDSWGLLEHGTSIGYAWLTDNGKMLLDFLRDFGTDDQDHPEWVEEFSWTLEPKEWDAYWRWESNQQ